MRHGGIRIHIFIAALSLFALARSGAWKQASRFHATVLYMVAGNLLYFFLTTDYLLWAFVPDLHLIPVFTELLYTFIVFPCTVILFLSGFPDRRKEQVWRYSKWVALYAVMEAIYAWSGRIVYDHGWSWWCSFAFDVMMFPMLLLHSKKPGIAYVLSAFIIAALLLMFRVPIWNITMHST
ncbi:CBO0543 family protein [Paenibacillus solanacearum]|uniref:CBO0543 family protein n=1 Tax=Paenibacillus solanacearum TaxID=2048548 RepID=UPI001C406925|nr:CBO0543 family protein [Paenibacillus solanacearum]